MTKKIETNREHLIFHQQAGEINGRLQTQIDKTKYILKSIRSFYHGSNFVSRNEFHHYLKQTLNEHKSIQAIEWAPRIQYQDLNTYIQKAHKDGLENFKITRIQNGQLAPDLKRSIYYPVFYSEPFKLNKISVGFNLGSNPKMLTAMKLAEKENKMIATEPVKLIQENNQYAILIFSPIKKRHQLLGYATGVFRLKDLLQTAISPEKSTLFSLYLKGPHATELFSYKENMLLKVPQSHNLSEILKHTKIYSQLPIKIANETWQIYYTPTPLYLTKIQFWFTWAVLAGGLLSIILLALLLLTLNRQHQAIQEEVSKKTRLLNRTVRYDGLTNIPNRAYFFETLNKYFNNPKKNPSFALMYIDIDNFKSVNDTFGHQTGDQFLKCLVNKLQTTTRKSDFFARIGGDEFALICSNVKNYTDAKKIAKHLLKNCKHTPIKISSYEIKARISIGISVFPKGGESQEDLVSNADIAMYHSKKLGGNQIQCFNEKLAKIYHRRTLIRRALVDAQTNNELCIYYQPVIDAHSTQVVAIEALLRWNHPKLGFIPPDEFIPIAEKSGHIIKIGNWIIDTTIKEFNLLQSSLAKTNKNCMLTVNVSTVQLQDNKLVDRILKTLKTHNIAPKKLVVELTETALIENMTDLHKMLKTLSKANVKIALDDFGSGYSSLNYLQRLHIDIIKIDREFVKDLPQDKESLAITKTIIELARNINAALIAEGVETQDQAKLLRNLDCDYLQGYFFAKPMPAEELVVWLKKFGQ